VAAAIEFLINPSILYGSGFEGAKTLGSLNPFNKSPINLCAPDHTTVEKYPSTPTLLTLNLKECP
jgi:hypothetical protein